MALRCSGEIRCYMGNCDTLSLGAATGPVCPPVLCFYVCAAMCLAPWLAPAAAGNSQICAWLRRRSMKSHYIYTSCSSEMFREVLPLLCDTVGSCVRVLVCCAWFMCALQDACLPCWMLASSLFMCITAALTTLVSSCWFSLRVFIKKRKTPSQ